MIALCRADRSGTEDVVGRFRDLRTALRARDYRSAGSDWKRVHYRVVDLDDPERGDLDWDDAERPRSAAEQPRSLMRDPVDPDRFEGVEPYDLRGER